MQRVREGGEGEGEGERERKGGYLSVEVFLAGLGCDLGGDAAPVLADLVNHAHTRHLPHSRSGRQTCCLLDRVWMGLGGPLDSGGRRTHSQRKCSGPCCRSLRVVMRPLSATTGLAWMGRWYRLMKKVDDVISCTVPDQAKRPQGQSRGEWGPLDPHVVWMERGIITGSWCEAPGIRIMDTVVSG